MSVPREQAIFLQEWTSNGVRRSVAVYCTQAAAISLVITHLNISWRYLGKNNYWSSNLVIIIIAHPYGYL